MERTPIEQLIAIKSFLKQSNNVEGRSVEQIRQQMNEAVSQLPQLPGRVIEPMKMGHLSGEWVSTKGDISQHSSEAACETESEPKVILYFHGGGFTAGSCYYYRDLVARIWKASGVKVLLVEYRLAPEHPYPAAKNDAYVVVSTENGLERSTGSIDPSR